MNISDENFDFPDEILLEILVKLPIKSVFKFKSVSKNWLSLISDQKFASRSLDSPPFMLIFQTMRSYKLQTHGFVCTRSIISNKIDFFPFLPNQIEELKIVATSNDLILYQSDCHDFVVNPFTRECVRLSRSKKGDYGCMKTGLISYVRNGITSYDVVRATSSDAKLCLEIQTFSSACTSFETVNCNFDVEFDANRPCIALEGVLHWICNRMTALLAYDPCSSSRDQCRLIGIPNEAYKMNGMNAVLGTSCGKLCYFEMSGISIERCRLPRWKLWMLRDYTRGKWSLIREGKERYVESLGVVCSMLSAYSPLLPIAIHPWNQDLVYFWHETYVLTFDTKKGLFDDKFSSFSSAGVVSTSEIFPLLMPLCWTRIPNPKCDANVEEMKEKKYKKIEPEKSRLYLLFVNVKRDLIHFLTFLACEACFVLAIGVKALMLYLSS